MSDNNEPQESKIVKPTILFQQFGNNFKFHEVYPSPGLKVIPPAIYSLKDMRFLTQDPGAHHLKMEYEIFNLPKRIYGEHHERCRNIIEAFQENAGVTGALALGLKGTGKSLLAEAVCNEVVKLGFPVIFVPSDERVDPQLLKHWLYHLGEKCGGVAVFFDEFAKNYGSDTKSEDGGTKHNQSEFLNLFCDPQLKKTLFMVVENEKKDMNSYMLDRPGRFLFRIHYDGISKELARDIAADHNLSLELERELVDYVATNQVSMDVVMTFIKIAEKYPALTDFYRASAKYNIPAINGWVFSWKVTMEDQTSNYYPKADLMVNVGANGTRIVGKIIIHQCEFPVDLDLSVFKHKDYVFEDRAAKAFYIPVGPWTFTIVVHRSKRDNSAIAQTMGTIENNSTQHAQNDLPKDYKETFPIKGFTIDNNYLLEKGIELLTASSEPEAVVSNVLESIGVKTPANAEGKLRNNKAGKTAERAIESRKRTATTRKKNQ